jgi:hypothetical protein
MALVRLFAWAYLDQRPGERMPARDPKLIPTFQTRYARQVGHLALAYYLNRAFRGDDRIKDEDGLKMFNRFMESGGFQLFLESRRGAKTVLNLAKDADEKLNYVCEMSLYLCKCDKHILDRNKLTLWHANSFLYKMHNRFELRTLSKI